MTPPKEAVSVALRDTIAIVKLERPSKRNALSDGLMAEIEQAFARLPTHVNAAVLCGSGDHFCAGLDLSELKERNAVDGLHHSRSWHRILNTLEFGRVPIVAALHGAVVGGGLELASSCHIRVADDTAFFALPEGSRGIFVGGGGAVRVPKLVGAHRMLDMMLTGRVYKAVEGVPLGFAQYHVAGEACRDRADLDRGRRLHVGGRGLLQGLAAGDAGLQHRRIVQRLPDRLARRRNAPLSRHVHEV